MKTLQDALTAERTAAIEQADKSITVQLAGAIDQINKSVATAIDQANQSITVQREALMHGLNDQQTALGQNIDKLHTAGRPDQQGWRIDQQRHRPNRQRRRAIDASADGSRFHADGGNHPCHSRRAPGLPHRRKRVVGARARVRAGLSGHRMSDLSRREILQAAAVAALSASPLNLSGVIIDVDQVPAGDPLTLWYREPAKQWVEALPVGNGRLGAMIFGGVETERLQLNEDTLWSGGPYDSNNPELAALPEARPDIRRAIQGVHELIAKRMMANPGEMMYQTAGDLLLNFPDLKEATDYRRELNLDAAIARVGFTCNGVRYVRDFRHPGSSGDRQPFKCRSTGQTEFYGVNVESPADDDEMRIAGHAAVERHKHRGVRHQVGDAVSSCAFASFPKAVSFRLRTIRFPSNAPDSVVLMIAIATSFRGFDDVSGDPDVIAACRYREDRRPVVRGDTRGAHCRASATVSGVSIDLGTSDAANLPTDERVRSSESGDDPALAALYFQFGRYLLICSSRPGTQPANLQGIWNDQHQAAVGQQVHDQHQHGDELLAGGNDQSRGVRRTARRDRRRICRKPAQRRRRCTGARRLGRPSQHRSLACFAARSTDRFGVSGRREGPGCASICGITMSSLATKISCASSLSDTQRRVPNSSSTRSSTSQRTSGW